MLDGQDKFEKNNGDDGAAGLKAAVLSPQDNAVVINTRGSEAQATVDSEFGSLQIHDNTGSGKLASDLPQHDPTEMTSQTLHKGQDLSKMGIDGTFYSSENGEVLKLDNGVMIITHDGKTVVKNTGDAQVKSDVTENGVQTITYDDGTVVTLKDGHLHHVSQNHLKVSIDENGNPQLGVDKRTVAFLDIDKDGDLDAWPIMLMHKPKPEGRTPSDDNSHPVPAPVKPY